MGQQQLLLLVIGIVLVALAIMAAFPAMEKGFKQDEADGLLDRALSISTYAVQWKTQQDPFNGGNQSYELLATSGLETLAMKESTIRGQFAITAATKTTMEVTGVSDRYPEVGVRVFINQYEVDSSRVSYNGDITL